MPRYIDAEKLKLSIIGLREGAIRNKQEVQVWALNACEFMVETAGTADVEEVKHGEWEEVTTNFIDDLAFDTVASMRCSKCERYHNEVYHYGNPTKKAHYCPFCGARMDGGRV